jgi:hypothetical protein
MKYYESDSESEASESEAALKRSEDSESEASDSEARMTLHLLLQSGRRRQQEP